MTKIEPAEVFPPGEFLREELAERGWTQEDLAEILGRPTTLVNRIVNGKSQIMPETAHGLAEAFGTTPELWMNLESAYRLWRVDQPKGVVAKRASLFERFPINEMVKRRWIEPTESVDVLERRVLDFFGLQGLDDDLRLWPHAARKSTCDVTPAQWAWLYRASHLAQCVHARRLTEKRFDRCLEQLRQCTADREEIRRVPGLLAEGGIRLVVVQPLPRAKIDGACFWLDKQSPVIAISMRFRRIDSFWHTLMHELGHVAKRHGLRDGTCAIDEDLGSSARREVNAVEAEVDRFAANYLVDQAKLDGFIVRTRPLYYKAKIRRFSKVHGVHPGIVVGQLQHRGEIDYSHNREMLVDVREVVTSAALTDGWGVVPVV